QNLTYAKIKLSELRAHAADPAESDTIEALKKLIEQMSQETRSLTYELSPPLLYEIGLDAALDWLAGHFQQRYALNCRFEGTDEPETLDIDSRIVLFQSARELLFNVVKHAKASRAVLSCKRTPQATSVSIHDDGVGFDTSKLVSSKSGFGLFNVRERMQH